MATLLQKQALAMAGLRRSAAATLTPRLVRQQQQQSALYKKLLSDSKQDMIMSRHTCNTGLSIVPFVIDSTQYSAVCGRLDPGPWRFC